MGIPRLLGRQPLSLPPDFAVASIASKKTTNSGMASSLSYRNKRHWPRNVADRRMTVFLKFAECYCEIIVFFKDSYFSILIFRSFSSYFFLSHERREVGQYYYTSLLCVKDSDVFGQGRRVQFSYSLRTSQDFPH